MPEIGWEMRENPTGVKMAGSCQSVEEAVETVGIRFLFIGRLQVGSQACLSL